MAKLPDHLRIEVCVDSIQSALNAQTGGADRVELCDNLPEGGTTPSAGVIRVVREQLHIGLQVMIRPRGGDFLYSAAELKMMQYDIQVARDLGADGVVFGCLSPDGSIDMRSTEKLIRCSDGMSVTFHRAFDMASNPIQALEDLKGLGIHRILTSGQARTALDGVKLLAQLVRQAEDKIIILAGGGIRPYNIQEIVNETGVSECHVSGRTVVDSAMVCRNVDVSMGGVLPPSEYSQLIIDADVIRAFRQS